MSDEKPWTAPMPAEQFEFMREVIGAPSPVGLEGSMTHGVLKPYFEEHKLGGWGIHQFSGNAGIVLDTDPDAEEKFTVMIVGHADKIRMQVRHIGDDGKIWINSDSFLPTTLIGHEVLLFSKNPEKPSEYRSLEGGTVEAIGAIHFAKSSLRSGKSGIKKEMLYLELQVHGDNPKEQIEELGIRPGDPIILNRKIRRGFSPDTFYGAYLDNGLGSFVTAETGRLIAEAGGLDNVRVLFAVATHEEIGRMGSRVLAGLFEPDALIAVDVNHDYAAAPNVSDRRFPPLAMGEGFTISSGSVISEQLNSIIEETAMEDDIPLQRAVVGRDTGTDAMASVFAAVDSVATSIGFPIRNMHTISETGHTGDVLAAIHVIANSLKRMDEMDISYDDFSSGHPLLHNASPLEPVEIEEDEEEDEDDHD